MANQTVKVQARMEPDLKKAAEAVFDQLGISATEAIRIFYKQVELHQGLPFEVKIPNETTLTALQEAENPERLETFDSVDELFDNL
ncbi:MAG: type II toxin-antitoxin system RelB/DinJ family antitoxin [Symploca sp. SIO2G7]|nr:type II toxin-antitoxin system RelB/DinJ family antitoxin [Symploca sp. SIO2G7]